ncbi:MAG: RNA-binding protein [Dehalococcoidales bacterium]
MKIYGGNLSFDITESQITAEFGTYGTVESVATSSAKLSGRPGSFALVEITSKSEVEAGHRRA